MKMKTLSLMSLSILVLVMFMGVGSAVIFLDTSGDPIDTLVSEGNHNSQVEIQFKIQAEVEETFEKEPIIVSDLTLQEEPFTIKIVLSEMDILPSTLTLIEEISDIITLTVNIPEYQKPGEYLGVLTFDTGTLDVEITVNPTPELSVSLTQDLTKTQNGTIKITNTGNVALTNMGLEVVSTSPDFSVDFGSITSSLAPGNYEEIEVSSTNIQNLELGDDNTITIRAISTEANSSIVTLEVPVSFCDCQNLGDLKITIKDIENNGILGETFGDDDEWFPLEEIEVELEIENTGDEDIDDIEVAWGLYNTETQEWIIEDEERDFNLKDGDDKIMTITFELDDVDEFNNGDDYVFYVKATGEIDGGDHKGDNTCASDSEGIKMIIEDDFVVLYDVEFPEVVQCGAEVQILADVWNIGDDDQDDVYVLVYNKELGISEKVEIGDIDAFEEEKLEVTIEMPENAEEKWYALVFFVYDDDDELYETDEDGDAEFKVMIKVEGSCEVEPTAVVSATLESGGQAGEELVIKALVTNTGDELSKYELNAAGYDDWAEYSPLIEPSTIILGAGESKEVLITFTVNKDVSGEKSFDIELVSDDELIVKQPVQVSIEEKPTRFPGITGWAVSEGNLYLWAIGALNIILVIIIIIVAVRVARK